MLALYLIILTYSIVTTAICSFYCYKIANLSTTATKVYILLSYASDARFAIYVGQMILLLVFFQTVFTYAPLWSLQFWITILYLILEALISSMALWAMIKVHSGLTRIPGIEQSTKL